MSAAKPQHRPSHQAVADINHKRRLEVWTTMQSIANLSSAPVPLFNHLTGFGVPVRQLEASPPRLANRGTVGLARDVVGADRPLDQAP